MPERISDRIRPGLKDLKRLKGKVYFNSPMKRYTTIRVGGPAMAFCQPASLKDLVRAVGICRGNGLPYKMIGNGSNIIISDIGVRKVIFKMASPSFKAVKVCGRELSCGAGVLLNRLCHEAEAASLGGLEFLIGIPGTVGGAIIQNAGAYGRTISNTLKDIKVLDRRGNLKVLEKGEINFGYRNSGLREYIILGATLLLSGRGRIGIRKDITRYINMRLTRQDYTAPSAGCVFKNPAKSDMSAAEMIDRCGLKGRMHGGASISRRHANFIINRGAAQARDILALIALAKNKVKQAFGVRLQEEVEIIR